MRPGRGAHLRLVARSRVAAWAIVLLSPLGCQSSLPEGSRVSTRARRGADFALAGIDGNVVSSAALRGRVTLLLFAATFDLNSQAQAKHLEELLHTHVPRINAVLVVLEVPRNVEFARGFRDVLHLSYPVAMMDPEGPGAETGLPQVRLVPTWVVLDRSGAVSGVHEGVLDAKELAQLARHAE